MALNRIDVISKALSNFALPKNLVELNQTRIVVVTAAFTEKLYALHCRLNTYTHSYSDDSSVDQTNYERSRL